MPKQRALGRGKQSGGTFAEPNGHAGSVLAAAIGALGIAEEDVFSHREYSGAVVIVTRDGRKLTYPEGSRAS